MSEARLDAGVEPSATLKHLTYTPVTPHCGAQVHDIDLAAGIDGETVDEIEYLLVNHGVVFFRDQHLTREQHRDLGKRFGGLHIHPAAPAPEGFPEILLIHADEKRKGAAGGGWHSDVSCDLEPPAASMLYMKQMPAVGGDTLFSSMYAAYDALSDRMQQHLDGLTAVHGSDDVYQGGGYRSEDQGRQNPRAEHPVVRRHPITGRKALYVNSIFTKYIKGVPRKEGEALLRFLLDHIASPNFQCRFQWAVNSIAFWDNRCVQHYATDDYYPEVRRAERITIAGDRPVA